MADGTQGSTPGSSIADQQYQPPVSDGSGGGKYSHSSSGTSGGKSVSLTPRESAYSQLDQQMMKLFGRRATVKEKSAYFKALHSAEKRYASTSKSRDTSGGSSVTDAAGNTVSGSTSKSRSKSTSYNFDQGSFLYEYSVSLAENYIKAGKKLGGEAADSYNQVKNYAAQMGITMSDKTAIGSTLNMITGKGDLNTQKDSLRRRAIAMYGGISEQLKADPALTVRDVASDYIEAMSQMLDVSPNKISLFDNTLSKALTATKDGKPYTKTLNEFRADLRSDHRFQFSTMAHNEAKSLGQSLARSFGFGG